MGPATGSGPAASCGSGWRSLLTFGASIVLIGALLSLAALPFVDLPFVKVFRRCISIAAALSCWLLIRRDGTSLADYGLGPWMIGRRELVTGLLLGASTLAIMFGIGLLTGVCTVHLNADPGRIFDVAHGRLWETLVMFVPAALLIGVLEELVFRGIILQKLLPCSTTIAVALSSALYAAVHLKRWPPTINNWMELTGLFILGAVLAFAYLRTQRLWLAIGLHAALAYGARVNKLLVQFTDESMGWLTGSNRLVNGLAGWVALLGLGGIVWWISAERRNAAAHTGR